MIPKIIHQTFFSKEKVPQKVYDNIRKYAPEYEHRVYDDTDCINFLTEHYTEDHVKRFKFLKQGAHKADLFRYCVLYKFGGVYLDIKTQLIEPMGDYEEALHLCLSYDRTHIYNGIMIVPPNCPLFLILIDNCLKKSYLLEKRYIYNCLFLYSQVLKDIKLKHLDTKQSVFYGKINPYKYIIYDEINYPKSCTTYTLDRYGLCTYIVDRTNNKRLFKVRYHDFHPHGFKLTN